MTGAAMTGCDGEWFLKQYRNQHCAAASSQRPLRLCARAQSQSSQSLRITVPSDEAVPLQPAVAAAALAMSANERVVKRR
jgi:hypothetical protein